jgi:hypothetical protein
VILTPEGHVVACVDGHLVETVVAKVEGVVAALEKVPAVHAVQVLSAVVVAATA